MLATLSLLAALITAIVAVNATSQVPEEPTTSSAEPYADPFEDPNCAGQGPPELFTCLSESESDAQEDAAAWSAQVAGRQADAQAKGHLAIIFGLLGLTFAVFAVALDTGRRSASNRRPVGTRARAPGGSGPRPLSLAKPAPGEQEPPR